MIGTTKFYFAWSILVVWSLLHHNNNNDDDYHHHHHHHHHHRNALWMVTTTAAWTTTSSSIMGTTRVDVGRSPISILKLSSSSSSTQSPIISTTTAATTTTTTSAMIGTDPTTKPNYDQMIGPLGKWVDDFCLTLFRNQLRDQVLLQWNFNHHHQQEDDPLRADPAYYGTANYTQIVALAAAMNARGHNDQKPKHPNAPYRIQSAAQQVLRNMFPPWLPTWYRILFAQPFPQFSARMNAAVTAALGVWLMGECTVNDILVPVDTTTSTTTNETTVWVVGPNQGVLVTRCRFLEESQCASICLHSCKIPTQNFFQQQMGVPLLMEPNYTTGQCQFSFGVVPNVTTETLLVQTPCLTRCPTAGSYRRYHQGGGASHPPKEALCAMTEDLSLCS
jgi:Beta-carotene isomerase D27-like, C-terminal